MTSVENHLKKIKELLEELGDTIDKGIEGRPMAIGFTCSECSCQLLEFYLHRLDRIKIGKMIKHNWFKPLQKEQKKEPLIERKFPANFPKKNEIYELMFKIEESRGILIYGKSDVEQIKSMLDNFNKLKEIILAELKKMGVEIE